VSAVRIRAADPFDTEATALLETSHALMVSLFPPETNNYLSVGALCNPHLRFYVAELGGRVSGCGALALKSGYGELKSMCVAPDARRQGVGEAILAHIEAEARAANLPVLRLETGDKLVAAHKLYFEHGFTLCGPFGDYVAHAVSVFMEKRLG